MWHPLVNVGTPKRPVLVPGPGLYRCRNGCLVELRRRSEVGGAWEGYAINTKGQPCKTKNQDSQGQGIWLYGGSGRLVGASGDSSLPGSMYHSLELAELWHEE
jgi:hypothetical protein